MPFVDTAANATLTFWFRPGDATPARPAALYLALFTADPTGAGSAANELDPATSPGYARTAVAFDAPVADQVDLSADVTFPNPTADWAQVTHVAVVKSNVRGTADLISVLALDVPVTALTNKPLQFKVGDLDFAQD